MGSGLATGDFFFFFCLICLLKEKRLCIVAELYIADQERKNKISRNVRYVERTYSAFLFLCNASMFNS